VTITALDVATWKANMKLEQLARSKLALGLQGKAAEGGTAVRKVERASGTFGRITQVVGAAIGSTLGGSGSRHLSSPSQQSTHTTGSGNTRSAPAKRPSQPYLMVPQGRGAASAAMTIHQRIGQSASQPTWHTQPRARGKVPRHATSAAERGAASGSAPSGRQLAGSVSSPPSHAHGSTGTGAQQQQQQQQTQTQQTRDRGLVPRSAAQPCLPSSKPSRADVGMRSFDVPRASQIIPAGGSSLLPARPPLGSAALDASAPSVSPDELSDTGVRSLPSTRAGCQDPLACTKLGGLVSARGYTPRFFHRQVYGSRRVLSVDDDPVNQTVISSLLQPLGFEVVQAMNGWEALSALEESATLPDIILLDCMMPGMSGYVVCTSVRAEHGAPPPPSPPSSSQNVVMQSADRDAMACAHPWQHHDAMHRCPV
jgi:CheY-like chemotaxis protein